MQYGQSAPITATLWTISQPTNAMAAVAPPCSASQHQTGSAVRPSSRAPIAATTGKVASPMIGLGKPRTSDCAVRMIEPHERTASMLQLGR